VSGRRLPVEIEDLAARQIEAANDWWRANRPAAAETLSDELVRALDLISQQPGVGVPADSPRLSGVRRVLLPTAGYFLFYRVVVEREELHVLAFWHARRGTDPQL